MISRGFYWLRRVGLGVVAVLMAGFAASAYAAGGISKTDIEVTQGAERIVLYASHPFVIKKHFLLSGPERLVVDVQHMAHGKGVGLSRQYQGSLLKGVRFGQFDPQTSRIVIDLGRAPSQYRVEAPSQREDQGYRMMITLAGGGLAAGGQAPVGGGSFAPVPMDKPADAAQEAKKPVIVIDAGHGGKDVGAIGGSGTREKVVTLQYAQSLRETLAASGRYRVVMTRDDDTYLFLHDRVKIARDNKADVFISIHADSNPRADAKGFSIYTVSETASDAEAAALAARENKADIIGGIDLSTEDKAVADILIDLAQRETKNKASDLADIIVANMHPKVPLLTNTHRYAGFRVLKAPDTPSVLLEIGFLTNSSDEQRILSRENREKFNQSMLQGLDAYFKGR